MDYADYVNGMSTNTDLRVRCRCCGSVLFGTELTTDAFCWFCEAYTNEGERPSKIDADTKKHMEGVADAIKKRKWIDGIEHADALVKTSSPYALYGAANFYAAFSDHVYNDMNYALPGFMYENAKKRSDEPELNRYNAMALTSKSREYFYKAIRVVNDMHVEDPYLTHLQFMANIKLRRYIDAGTYYSKIKDRKLDDKLSKYEDMVYLFKVLDVDSIDTIMRVVYEREENSLYYLGNYFAKKGKFTEARWLLEKLLDATNSPMASALLDKIAGTEKAMGRT